MVDILSQDEINALLEVPDENSVKPDFGSPEFEKLSEDFHKAFRKEFKKTDFYIEKAEQNGYIPRIQGTNPKDMMDSLKCEEEYFQSTLKNYKKFKEFHKKFKKIADEQPEIFI